MRAFAPREQLLFDFGWKFRFGNGTDPAKDLGFGNTQGDFAKTGDFALPSPASTTRNGESKLPHDWAVELPFVRDEAAIARVQAARTALSRDERRLVPARI